MLSVISDVNIWDICSNYPESGIDLWLCIFLMFTPALTFAGTENLSDKWDLNLPTFLTFCKSIYLCHMNILWFPDAAHTPQCFCVCQHMCLHTSATYTGPLKGMVRSSYNGLHCYSWLIGSSFLNAPLTIFSEAEIALHHSTHDRVRQSLPSSCLCAFLLVLHTIIQLYSCLAFMGPVKASAYKEA